MIVRIFAMSVPTKPLNDAQMRGAFLYIYVHSQNTLMERLPHFTKHYMTEMDGRTNRYGHDGCKCSYSKFVHSFFSRNSKSPTVRMPLSSIHGLMSSRTTMIFLNASLIFRSEAVS